MSKQHFVVALVQGTAEDLNRNFVKCPGMTVIEVTEDTYDFLYNSLIEKATSEQKGRGRS
jgi:hypothetical protein